MKEILLRKAAWLVYHLANLIAPHWNYHSARLYMAASKERCRKQSRKIIHEGRVMQGGN